MKFFIKVLLISVLALIWPIYCHAQQRVVVMVSSANIPDVKSSQNAYPDISQILVTDIIDTLSKNMRFEVLDTNESDDLLKLQYLNDEYKEFLSNYRNKRVIDYKMCRILFERIGVDKLILVSSNLNMQKMIVSKKSQFDTIKTFRASDFNVNNYLSSFFSKEPIMSYYVMNVLVTYLDTQSARIINENIYVNTIDAGGFEVASNSFGENLESVKEMQKISVQISQKTAMSVFGSTPSSSITSVSSNIVSSSPKNIIKTTDGKQTMDGRPSSSDNNYKIIRKQKFEQWAKESSGF